SRVPGRQDELEAVERARDGVAPHRARRRARGGAVDDRDQGGRMSARVPQNLDVGLALLDRQIVDCNERPLANVDDVHFAVSENRCAYIDALLCGPGAWAPRLHGRLGRWIRAVWARLHPAVHPTPSSIPMNVVTKIDSAVHLSVPRRQT